MRYGKAFEIFAKTILISLGFSEVPSDGLYVFDGTPGQMIQGLGEAHNADVLLEPPVQTPFYSRTRLLIECKNYSRRVGLNTLRSALGLREDINHFDIVDLDELMGRRNHYRNGIVHEFDRYSYQVALAAMNGYTKPAQKFALTHHIPLIEFDKMPFWVDFRELLDRRFIHHTVSENTIIEFSETVGSRMALGVTGTGQLLFLYAKDNSELTFGESYSLHWASPHQPWELRTNQRAYLFQLPDDILKYWLKDAQTQLQVKQSAIDCKASFFSNMVIYYREYGLPKMKMISIDKYQLEEARDQLNI